jgi:hypothetical protein
MSDDDRAISDDHGTSIKSLFGITRKLSTDLASVGAQLDGLTNSFSRIESNLQDKSQPPYQAIGLIVILGTFFWGVVVTFMSAIGYLFYDSVKADAMRNEGAILRLVEADHKNQKNIAALTTYVQMNQRESEQHREWLQRTSDSNRIAREFSLEGHARQDERLDELERQSYGSPD